MAGNHNKKTEERITKRFRIRKDIDPLSIPALPQIVTLMMFRDAILSAIRWHKKCEDIHEVDVFTDRIFSLVAVAGWAAEAIRLLKDLHKEGVITDETIAKVPYAEPVAPQKVWAECVVHSIFEVGRLHRIRDNCFAHFYNRDGEGSRGRYAIAVEAIEALARGDLDVPFAQWTETSGRKQNTKSSATLAMVSILRFAFGVKGELNSKDISRISEQAMKIAILIDHLFAVLVDENGLEFEPCEFDE